jgi:hypothetical protein
LNLFIPSGIFEIGLRRYDPHIGQRLACPRSVGAHKFAKFLRTIATDNGTRPDQFIPKCGCLEDLCDALLQAIDHVARGASRNEESLPTKNLNASDA